MLDTHVRGRRPFMNRVPFRFGLDFFRAWTQTAALNMSVGANQGNRESVDNKILCMNVDFASCILHRGMLPLASYA